MNDFRPQVLSDESFDELLERGGILLSENRPAEARTLFERANDLSPDDSRCLNLMGLTYFRLKMDRQAAEVYRRLVEANPQDGTLRMNLGLVYLRLEQYSLAVSEFEAALVIDSSMTRAHHYLAKAFSHLSDFALAQEHYSKAGEPELAEKMLQAQRKHQETQVFASENSNIAFQESQSHFEESGATMPAFVPAKVPQVETPLMQSPVTENSAEISFDDGELIELTKVVRPSRDMVALEGAPTNTGGAHVSMLQLLANGSPPALPNSAIAETARRVLLAENRTEGVFTVADTHCILSVNGMLNARLEGWLAMRGEVHSEPLRKMYNGTLVAETFGEDTRIMQRLTGYGSVVLDVLGRKFGTLNLIEETAFFKESAVAAFESSILYENGRIEGTREGEWLPLVGLTGPGRLLVEIDGDMRAIEVKPEAPVTLSLRHVLGWIGQLRPELVSPSGPALRLSGAGYVLFSVPNPGTR